MTMELIFAPSPSLKGKSRLVEDSEFGPELLGHMQDMHNKMKELKGIGLAGVQVGDFRRILVVDSGDNLIMMVNPEIIDKSDFTTVFEEGCLSLPGARITVERSEEITVSYKTPKGELREDSFFELEAVAIQHEIDHLNGITILDKVSRLKRDIYLRKIKKVSRKIKHRIEQNNSLYY